MPARVEEPRSFHLDARQAFLQLADLFEPALQVILVAEDPDEILHRLLKVPVDVVRAFARGALEGREQFSRGLLDLSGIPRGGCAGAAGMARRGLARPP